MSIEHPTSTVDRYSATYSDAGGCEQTVITNDGRTLEIQLRGLAFAGSDFDSLAAPEDATADQLRQFPLDRGCLCSCRISCQIPVPIGGRRQSSGVLFVDLVLGDPAPNGGLDREQLRIALHYDDQRLAGPGTSGWFEDELLAIQAQMPEGVFMKACINCLYSDYSPAGHGLFGCMMCFRNIKAEYVKVRSKAEFWSVHDRCERLVQETYLCPEFARRIPGTGYRG
jgi:hypothetical protein